MEGSIWRSTVKKPEFDALEGDIKTDVLIIGGGIAGILCADTLKRAGVDYILAEAEGICGGVSENTTAKITLQHGLIYGELIRKFGLERARLYLEAQLCALRRYRELCADIECDFEDKPSYVYSTDDRNKLEREASALDKLGFSASFTDNIPLPIRTVGGVKTDGQAQFNPLKFAYSLAKDLKIFENTRILRLEPNGAVSDRGRITAKKIIVATHFPFINKHGFYFLKLYQHRSYVIALKNAEDVGGMYVDEKDTGMSFRNYKDMLLLGGGGHRTGKKGGGWQELSRFASDAYPDSKEVRRWATQDCMSLDGAAYIGQYSKGTTGVYTASGFNKWGMTSAMVSASVLCDLVLERKNPYVSLFSPSRSMLRKQLFINTGEALLGLITPMTPRCTHMGCVLKYNKYEHSWDCACHGSRFSKDGRVLNNPAKRNK
ncbi:MAG: FAD-dependent oxidoreductase [Clostridia bacterium]|nr:FAD-dependent oxidoreductase [Clostridia bacterium]